jgi:Lrp/AsnC family transcriptional regulator for asnA, asnC and gidA
MHVIDELDKKILNILGNDTRASLSEIAKVCEVSSAAIHQRIKKLEETKVIIGSRLILDPKKLGINTIAFVGVFFEKAGYYKKVLIQLEKIPQITECNFTTGNYSLLLKICCQDNQHLMEVLSNNIQNIDGIARTETFICLENPIDRAFEL